LFEPHSPLIRLGVISSLQRRRRRRRRRRRKVYSKLTQ